MTIAIVHQDFNALITSASENRPSHINSTFIRVDLWGKGFGKPLFGNYEKEPTSKKYLKAVSKKSSFNLNELVIKPGRGNKSGVWVHPLIASHYAETGYNICIYQIDYARYRIAQWIGCESHPISHR